MDAIILSRDELKANGVEFRLRHIRAESVVLRLIGVRQILPGIACGAFLRVAGVLSSCGFLRYVNRIRVAAGLFPPIRTALIPPCSVRYRLDSLNRRRTSESLNEDCSKGEYLGQSFCAHPTPARHGVPERGLPEIMDNASRCGPDLSLECPDRSRHGRHPDRACECAADGRPALVTMRAGTR